MRYILLLKISIFEVFRKTDIFSFYQKTFWGLVVHYIMETKKKHSEEVAELNEQIDFVFGSLPSLLQVYYYFTIL